MRLRNRRLLAAFAVAAFVLPVAYGADPGGQVKAAGLTFLVPPAAQDFVEVGDQLRTTFFEVFVPTTNRLLSAYLPAQAAADLRAGKTTGVMDVYAMLETPRRAEYVEITPSAFAQVLTSTESTMGTFDPKAGLEDEMNMRLKTMGAGKVELSQPQSLGGLFKKENEAGYAMVVPMKTQKGTATMLFGMGVLRVKKHLFFAYLYRKYDSPESLTWLHQNLEWWSDAIVRMNGN